MYADADRWQRGQQSYCRPELWILATAFGGDPRAVGRRIRLNDKAHDVVGIMPSWFNFPRGVDLWTPLELSPAEDRSGSVRPCQR